MAAQERGGFDSPDYVDLPGKLLVASAAMDDPNFRRVLLLILDADPEGAVGVILNRPTEVDVAEVLPGWEGEVAAPSVVFEGGPVGADSALCLTRVREGQVPGVGWRPLSGDLGLADLDVLSQASDFSGMARVYSGYSGWSAGQLSAEIAQGAWHVVEPLTDEVFDDDPRTLWQRVLSRQTGSLRWLTTLPEDPSSN